MYNVEDRMEIGGEGIWLDLWCVFFCDLGDVMFFVDVGM